MSSSKQNYKTLRDWCGAANLNSEYWHMRAGRKAATRLPSGDRYFAPERDANYCSHLACMSVCCHTCHSVCLHISKITFPNFRKLFVLVELWLRLSPPLMAVQYVMYLWFYFHVCKSS